MKDRIKDAFDHIKADSQLKESTKQFIFENSHMKETKSYHLMFYKPLIIFSIILFIAVGIGSYSWVNAPMSYISIDVNPSIELTLNRYNTVISVKAYNKEGENVIGDMTLKGKKYMEAINSIIDSKNIELYLNKKSQFLFAIASNNKQENDLKVEIENYLKNVKYDSQSIIVDMSTVTKAHDNGCSSGKYSAYLQLSQLDNSITIDECKHMSVSEIYSLIDQHKHGEHHESNHSHTSHNDHDKNHK